MEGLSHWKPSYMSDFYNEISDNAWIARVVDVPSENLLLFFHEAVLRV